MPASAASASESEQTPSDDARFKMRPDPFPAKDRPALQVLAHVRGSTLRAHVEPTGDDEAFTSTFVMPTGKSGAR